MSKKIIVVTDNGKETKDHIRFEVVKKAKKRISFVWSLVLIAGLLVSSYFLQKYTIQHLGTNSFFNSTNTNEINDNVVPRTEAENIMSTVNIQTLSNINFSSGTGEIIYIDDKEMLIVTARHCVEEIGNASYVIRFFNADETIATLKTYSTSEDWAILTIPIDNVPLNVISVVQPVVLNCAEIKVNEEIYSIRSHFNDGITKYFGTLESKKEYSMGNHSYTRGFYLKTNYYAPQGTSGGAAYDNNGFMIGLCSQSDDIDGVTLFCPVDNIVEYLKTLN